MNTEYPLTGTLTATPLITTNTFVSGTSNTYLNTPNKMTNQVNVAIFKVTRSEDSQKVISTQFLKQMWVELKPNADLKLVVASKLSKEDLQGADLSELDIRELMTVDFY